jgi:hypothetical protein
VVDKAQNPGNPAKVQPVVFRDDRNSRKLSGKGELEKTALS